MFKEVTASEILSNPEKIDVITDKYGVIFDQAMDSRGFQAMDEAVNMMVKRGWKCIDIIVLRRETIMMVHALMERV